MQAQESTSEKMRSAKESARLAAGRKVVSSDKESGSSSSSALNKNLVERRPRPKKE